MIRFQVSLLKYLSAYFRERPRLLFRDMERQPVFGIMDFINYLLIMAGEAYQLKYEGPDFDQQTGEKMNGLASIKCIKAISPLS